MRIHHNAIEAIWGDVSGPLKLANDTHSPVMQATSVNIQPHGVEVKCTWAHEGNIRSEWISADLLERVDAKSST